MGLMIRMPLVNVNDEQALLVRWLVSDGAKVPKDEPIAIIETTKSAVDVVADRAGFVRVLAEPGASYPIGHPLAFIAERADEEVAVETTPAAAAVTPQAAQPGNAVAPATWTKKAQILATRLNVDLAALAAKHPGGVIGEEHVKAEAARTPAAPAIKATGGVATRKAATAKSSYERVLILGGGGGAALVIDILSRTLNQKPAAILDNNKALVGTALMNVPILGDFEVAARLWDEGAFDTIISTVVRDVNDRAQIFERFTAMGIPFTNVIDPDVRIGADVTIGTGNLIIYGGYLATAVTLGDNNFLAAGTCIEHHSKIGSHCTFGPRTSLSGKVVVADRVKFGTNVAVEPQVEIGTRALIASGVVLTSHVPAGAVVKSAATAIIRSPA